jgi:hypothetical protein
VLAPTSPLLGKTTPRIFTPPLVTGPPGPCGCGCALTPATSLGFLAEEFAQDTVGIPLLPWQRWLLIHALELLPNGRFRFRTVLVLVSRQNGKTRLVELKNLFKMIVLQVPLVIGTAQNLDTAEESWDRAVELVETVEELSVHLLDVDKTNGKKALKLTNGSRWKIAAASRRGGRGLSGDDVNLDELREHLAWDAWGAVTKTTMARPKAQVWAYSNAGDRRSVVLNTLQAQGRTAAKAPPSVGQRMGYFEWSAPDDVMCTCERVPGDPHAMDCRLRDRAAWAQANPALGYTITVEALESALDTDPEEIFRTECLCQRVPDLGGRAIDMGQWARLADPESKRAGDLVVAVDIPPLRDYAAVGVYGVRADGLGHFQLTDYRAGVGWVVDRMVEMRDTLDPIAFAMGSATYNSLKTALTEAGITVPEKPDKPKRGDLIVLSAADMTAACGQALDVIREGSVRYVPRKELDEAASGAKLRSSGDAVAWSRKTAQSDIAPIVTFTEGQWAYRVRMPMLADDDYDVMASIG